MKIGYMDWIFFGSADNPSMSHTLTSIQNRYRHFMTWALHIIYIYIFLKKIILFFSIFFHFFQGNGSLSNAYCYRTLLKQDPLRWRVVFYQSGNFWIRFSGVKYVGMWSGGETEIDCTIRREVLSISQSGVASIIYI